MNNLDFIQNIFHIVINKDNELKEEDSRSCNEIIYIQFDQQQQTGQIIDEHLEAILFERLLMNKDDLNANLIKVERKSIHNQTLEDDLKETNPLIYLFECYQRLHFLNPATPIKSKFKNVILNQANKYLINIYPTLEAKPLLVYLLDKHYFEADDQLLKEFLKTIGTDDDDCDLNCLIDVLKDAYYNELCTRISKMEFSDPNLFKTINFIRLLTLNSKLSLAFIRLNSPWHSNAQFNFDFTNFSPTSSVLKTLMGHLLSISSLPKFTDPNFRYFQDAMSNTPDQTINLEKNIGCQIHRLVREVHNIFLSMLKLKDVKEETLNYICLVLYCFKNRSQIWINQLPNLVALTDGFMLNFLFMILLLCKPFSDAYSDKLLKIDPRYTALPSLPLNEINKNEMEKIHLRGLTEDAYLMSKPENEKECKEKAISLLDKNNFNFMTEIFFACHKAIQLAFKSCYDRFLTLAQSLSELSRAQLNNRIPNQEMVNLEMNNQLTKYYSTKTVICQDDFIELFIKFNMATATWLTNIGMYSEHLTNNNQQIDDLNLNKFYPFQLKIDVNLEETRTSKLLQYVPEYVCENVSESLIFIQRFADNFLMINTINFQPIINFIIAYMASPQRMKNPHLRAKLTEVLEELIPKNNQQQQQSFRMNANEYYSNTFQTYEHKQYLIPCLIHVFVSIELTGQSVAFEQKFQYRRSIYAVLEHLWTEPSICEIYKQSMIELSEEAVTYIENPNPPLFLR